MDSTQVHKEKIHRPTESEIKSISDKFNFHFSDSDFKAHYDNIVGIISGYDDLLDIPDYLPEVKYPRKPGTQPSKEENPYGAWYVKTEIQGASKGKLLGRKIVLKDNVCLAGVPMMNGARHLEGYIPEIDATIVTRLLDEGATIVGKAHCEALCFSAGSHTCVKGAVQNPNKLGHTSGGSSSGSAVLVALGEVDMGIGGDQGGSIRIPSAFCGCCGMKATHGLVPYTGVMSMEPSLDHVGPITRNVKDNALMLEVLAGVDDLDPRQYIPESVEHNYTEGIDNGVKGLKIGMVKEGFRTHKFESIVGDLVKKAAIAFESLGATVEEVSVPEHNLSPIIMNAVITEGPYYNMMQGNGYLTGSRGLYLPSMMRAQSKWKENPDQLPESLKSFTIAADYLKKEFQGTLYAKAQNLNRKLKKGYDDVLKQYDILIMPTIGFRAPKLPSKDTELETMLMANAGISYNTRVFNLTGHPALSLPIAQVDDLPIGMMLVSKYYGEKLLYRAGYAWEKAHDWKKFD